MKHKIFLISLIVLLPHLVFSQKNKKALDFSVYDDWKIIENQQISNNGEWVAYEINPYKGDGKLVVKNPNTSFTKEFERGKDGKISANSSYIVLKVSPEHQKIRKLKIKKVKKDKLPKDSLKIFVFDTQKTIDCANIKEFKIAKEKSDWLAYTNTSKPKDKKTTKKSDKKKKSKQESSKKDETFNLTIINPVKNVKYTYNKVTDFNISENGSLIGFVQEKKDKKTHSTIFIFDTETEKLTKIFASEGTAKKVTLDNGGKQAAFIFSSDTTKVKTYSLYHWQSKTKKSVEVVIDKNSLKIPKDWLVSEYGKIWFSKDNSRLYFGTAARPKSEVKDTIPDDEKIKVDIWSWTDKRLQTQQLVELKKDKKRSYLTVYDIGNKKVARLSDKYVP